jgi:putative ABC transport system permease protein
MTGAWNDFRFAVRGLLRSPGFTTVAVMTLALGIGANTAVFTLVDGVLISPLPVSEPERLIRISHLGRDGQDQLPVSTGLYLLYDREVRGIESIALHQANQLNMAADGEEPLRVEAQTVTPSYFEVLRVQPMLGRAFTEAEGVAPQTTPGQPPAPPANPVVILSNGLWERAFASDPDILGRTLVLNGLSRTIVGVMPPDVGYPLQQTDVFLPMAINAAQAPIANFSATGVARLTPDATFEGVQAELTSLIGRLGELYPEGGQATFLAEVGLKSVVEPLKQAIVGDVSQSLWVLLGTVAFVLLIACANVANLLLVRAEGRHRELALRVAVGASRTAVLRPFLSESAALATAGGLMGLVVAALAVKLTTSVAPTDIPRIAEVGIDLRALGFTAAIVIGTAVLSGLLPVLRYGRRDVAAQLRESGDRSGTGGVGRHRVRNALVVAQVALALVLLVGSGLMVRSFFALRSVDPGFDPEGVLTVRLTVPTGDVPQPAAAADFFRQLVDRLRSQPGVVSVGAVQGVPLTGLFGLGSMESEDHPRGPEELPVMAAFQRAEAGFFETMEVDILEGRPFQRGDGADGTRAAVVSQSFAQKWWPNGSALGRRVRQGPNEDWYEIVGVAQDVHQVGLETPAEEMVYLPALWGPAATPIATRTMDLVVRVTGDPLAFLPVIRREVAALNPRIPLSNPRSMTDILQTSTARTSFTMVILGSAAFVALILGLVGIYGVISYIVNQRTREIGVRMALGASASTVRGMVVKQGTVLAAVGVVLGLIAAFGLSRLMTTMLFGVSASDPITYVGVAVGLAGVAVLASWIPAVRAAGVDPAIALRGD